MYVCVCACLFLGSAPPQKEEERGWFPDGFHFETTNQGSLNIKTDPIGADIRLLAHAGRLVLAISICSTSRFVGKTSMNSCALRTMWASETIPFS